MLEHRRMLRRVLPLAVALSLGAVPFGAGGCNRGGSPGPAFPQPIRDEKEPGESFDTVSSVPDTGSSSVEDMTSGSSSENELEIDEDSATSDESKDGEKSADKSDDEAGGDDEGGEDETGNEPDDPSDIDGEVEP